MKNQIKMAELFYLYIRLRKIYSTTPGDLWPQMNMQMPIPNVRALRAQILSSLHLGCESQMSCIAPFLSFFLSFNIHIIGHISKVFWPIFTKLGQKYQWVTPLMSRDQYGVRGQMRSNRVKNRFSLKKFQLLYIWGHFHETHAWWPPNDPSSKLCSWGWSKVIWGHRGQKFKKFSKNHKKSREGARII